MRALIVAVALLAAGCQSSTPHGECIGAFDDPDPALVYKTSTRNVVLGVIFVETLIVPAVVIATETKCPTARRQPPAPGSQP